MATTGSLPFLDLRASEPEPAASSQERNPATGTSRRVATIGAHGASVQRTDALRRGTRHHDAAPSHDRGAPRLSRGPDRLGCTLLGSISAGRAGLAVLIVALAARLDRATRGTPVLKTALDAASSRSAGARLVGAVRRARPRGRESLRPDAIAVETPRPTIWRGVHGVIARARTPSAGDLFLLAPFTCELFVRILGLHPRSAHVPRRVWMYSSASCSSPTAKCDRARRQRGQGLARRPRAEHLEPTGSTRPGDRGSGLPGLRTTGVTPKVVVTYVFDGGGWNVLASGRTTGRNPAIDA